MITFFREQIFHGQALFVDYVRQRCVDHFVQHASLYRDFIAEDFWYYVATMRREDSWGGEIELSALSSRFGFV